MSGKEERQWGRVLANLDFSSELAYAEKLTEQQTPQKSESQERTLQGLDTTPTIVTSVTFIEADATPTLNIINQDSTYFSTSSSDDAVLSYTSISAGLDVEKPLANQENLVPGGVMMVLFGVNSASEVVQNTIAWAYNMDNCDVEPLADGDGVGWLTVDGYAPPHAEFCSGVTRAPTVSPSERPTDPPLPEAATAMEMPPGEFGCKSSKSERAFTKSGKAGGKSCKGSKSEGAFSKSGKTGKSSKGGKSEGAFAKSGKTGKSSKGVDSKSGKGKIPHTAKSTKATKVLHPKSAKAKSAKSEESTKAETYEMLPKGTSPNTFEVPHMAKSTKATKVLYPKSTKSAKSEEWSKTDLTSLITVEVPRMSKSTKASEVLYPKSAKAKSAKLKESSKAEKYEMPPKGTSTKAGKISGKSKVDDPIHRVRLRIPKRQEPDSKI